MSITASEARKSLFPLIKEWFNLLGAKLADFSSESYVRLVVV